MADILRVAKERRAALLAEITRLDDFLRMAEALRQSGRQAVHAADGLAPFVQIHPGRDGLPLAVEGAGSAAAGNACARPNRSVAVEAPRLLLPHYPETASPAGTNVVAAMVDAAAGPARVARKLRDAFGAYIEALRQRIERHFGGPWSLPPLVASHAASAQRDLGWRNAGLARVQSAIADTPAVSAFVEALRHRVERHFAASPSTPMPILSYARLAAGNLAQLSAAAAEPAAGSRENGTASQFSRVASARTQGSAATPWAHEVKPVRKQAGSMADVAASIEQLRERNTPTARPAARSFDIHVGQRIRQRRWMLGMSQKQLGDHIGLERSQIEQYESGVEHIDATTVWRIAAALEVPVAFFFEGVDGHAADTGEARGEVLSDEEALMQFGDFSDDTIIFASSRSA